MKDPVSAYRVLAFWLLVLLVGVFNGGAVCLYPFFLPLSPRRSCTLYICPSVFCFHACLMLQLSQSLQHMYPVFLICLWVLQGCLQEVNSVTSSIVSLEVQSSCLPSPLTIDQSLVPSWCVKCVDIVKYVNMEDWKYSRKVIYPWCVELLRIVELIIASILG